MSFPDGKRERPPAGDASAQEQAVEWISRRESGLSAAEETEFQTWLATDPTHAAAVHALQPSWSALNRSRRLGEGDLLRARVANIVRRRRRRTAAAFASLGAAAAIAIGLFVTHPAAERAVDPIPTVVVRPDRQRLPDGSVIDLNAGAEIALDYTAAHRRVQLIRGEALFHVAKDPARPFIVAAHNIAVRAVGTAFTVRVEPATVDVLVTEGVVALEPKSPVAAAESDTSSTAAVSEPSPAPPAFRLAAGNRVVIPAHVTSSMEWSPRAVSPEELAAALAWRHRRVEFDGTTLAEAVELFNRDNALQLAVTDRETGALRISGVFWTNEPEAFARAVQTSLGVMTSQSEHGKVVFRR